MKNFNEFTEDMKVRQDPDIKDREGTQPAKYYAGDMSKATNQARARHFEKKKSGPAPGEKSAKTKPSKHTLKYKQMFGEDSLPVGEENLNEKIEGLVKKAEKSVKGFNDIISSLLPVSCHLLKSIIAVRLLAFKEGANRAASQIDPSLHSPSLSKTKHL